MSKLREFIEKLRKRLGRGPAVVTAFVRKLVLATVLTGVVGLSLLADAAVHRADLQLNPFTADCPSAVQLCSR